MGARFRATSVRLDLTNPRYNVAPGQIMPVVVRGGGQNGHGEGDAQNALEMMKWGLVPSWAKDPRIGNKMINARAETILEKPSYRKPLQSKRCLIPASGFYEWQETGGSKVPYHIYLKDEPLFAFAGLYDRWTDAQGQALDSYTIITTSANDFMEKLHHRMPVILSREVEEEWLDPATPLSRLVSLMTPYRSQEMAAVPASPRLNNVRNDDPSLLSAEA